MSSRFQGRREDNRLLTGTGRFVADCNLEDQLYGCFLRSDRAHARLVALDMRAAAGAPGVAAVFTAADAAAEGFRSPKPMAVPPGLRGEALRVPGRSVFAAERVRFVGEPVALVVARSRDEAQDAVELLDVQWQDLPAVAEPASAVQPDAPQLYAEVTGNVCLDYEYGDAVAVDEAFGKAAHRASILLEASRLVGNPMEPKACLADYDAAARTYDLYAPHQGPSMILKDVAGVTGVPMERIRLRPIDVGGGFGVRTDGYPEYCALMLATRRLGRPVKWVASRAETFVSDFHGRAATLSGEVALDAHGHLLALRLDWLVNMGAYLSLAGAFINTVTPSLHASNAYRCPHLHGRHRLVLTNTVPTTAYRGAGRPNITYLIERLIDEAARQTGIDRLELRRRNALEAADFPYRTPTTIYDSGDHVGLLEEAVRRAAWDDFEARRTESAARGRLRGIGCALFVEPSGGGAVPEQAAVLFSRFGEATIHTLAGATGQGHETVFPQIVSAILGIPEDSIRYCAGAPPGLGLSGDSTYGSRSMIMHGGALVQASHKVIRKGMAIAARQLEVATEDLEFESGIYRVKGTNLTRSLVEVVRAASEGALDSVGELSPARAFPSGAHVAEVEVDPETGGVEIVRYTAVDDCGRALSPVLLEGQLQGAIQQGAGQVLEEHCVYDASAQLLTATFMDYAMPRAGSIKDLSLYARPMPSPANPLGVKGAGEAGTTGAVPALANAVVDALRSLGVQHVELPCTPYRIWRAIQAARLKAG
jgi:aerobic carbon-monoxide dehydrogenase large subunit